MNAFTIRDLENLSGVKAHTIRVWEQRYGFLKPQRTSTNIRYYSCGELKTLLNVSLLNKYGFKISQIDQMPLAEMEERIHSLQQPDAVQEKQVNELIRDMVDMDAAGFDRTLTEAIQQRGVERTVSQLIFPFLEKTGMLWQTGHIHPAQEHLSTHLIRQKLIVAIETTVPVHTGKQQVVLYTPEGEFHELGLLYVYYLMKSRGVPALYLGTNVPVKDVGYVANMKKISLAYMHLTPSGQTYNFDRLLLAIRQYTGHLKTYISGQLARSYRKAPPSCVEFKQNMQEVSSLVNALSNRI